MEPTAAGHRLYDQAVSILKSISNALHDVCSAVGQVSGNASVGTVHSAVKAIGVKLLQYVSADLPYLRVSLTGNVPNTSLKHRLSTDIDLAIIYNLPRSARAAAFSIMWAVWSNSYTIVTRKPRLLF